MMFLRLQTQWNVITGAYIGLKYSSIEFLFRVYGVEDQRAMLEDLMLMEQAVLKVLNKPKD